MMKVQHHFSYNLYTWWITAMALPALVRAAVLQHGRLHQDGASSGMTRISLIAALLHDDRYRRRCSKRTVVFWKMILREFCIEANIRYPARLRRIGWSHG